MLFGWSVPRTLILFDALGFALVAIQVSLFHYRGNFRNPAMWVPVLTAPLLTLLLGWYALAPSVRLHQFLGAFLLIELLGGLFGFGMHTRGINQRVGGFGMNNVLTGPPIILPLTLTGFSLMGLLALYPQFF